MFVQCNSSNVCCRNLWSRCWHLYLFLKIQVYTIFEFLATECYFLHVHNNENICSKETVFSEQGACTASKTAQYVTLSNYINRININQANKKNLRNNESSDVIPLAFNMFFSYFNLGFDNFQSYGCLSIPRSIF